MATTAELVWFWSLPILPFTAFLTFIVTLIACNLSSNYARSGDNLLQIHQLGYGHAYVYFISGVIMLIPQLVAIIIGRFQFLLQSQSIIKQIPLYIIHAAALIPIIFTIIVAIVSKDHRHGFHVLLAYGIFGFIAFYCFLHTIVIVYLYIRRSNAPQYSNVIWPIWFLVCSLLLIGFFIVWFQTSQSMPEYIAASAPFLYFIGFVPQFWSQARSKKRYIAVPKIFQ